MNFFSKIGRAFSRLWHDIPASDEVVLRGIARQEAQNVVAQELPKAVAAIDKATKSPLGDVVAAAAEAKLAPPKSGGVSQ